MEAEIPSAMPPLSSTSIVLLIESLLVSSYKPRHDSLTAAGRSPSGPSGYPSILQSDPVQKVLASGETKGTNLVLLLQLHPEKLQCCDEFDVFELKKDGFLAGSCVEA